MTLRLDQLTPVNPIDVLKTRSLRWQRPQWRLRTMLVLMLAAAAACSLVASYYAYARKARSAKIEWVPYSAAKIASCDEAGVPVVVVYQDCFSSVDQTWATAPFDDPETARLLNEMAFVAMDPCLNLKVAVNGGQPIADFPAMQRAARELGGGFPIIAIYDRRGGGTVIRPKNESYDERRERVGRMLRDYCSRLANPEDHGKGTGDQHR